MTHAPSRYCMPAEWQPQTGTWVAWPHNRDTWTHNLAEAQCEFVEFVRTIARSQPVFILASGKAQVAARAAFESLDPNIQFVDIPTNDAWARDYAPTFVLDQQTNRLVAIDWHYNAWGGKYPPFDKDQKVAGLVAEHLNIECVSPEFCFEGGAIEINDSKIVLTTRSCAFDPNRNSGTTQPQVETILQQTLGAEAIVWLTGDAIEGDDTDGHIDQLARFTDDKTIVYACSNQPGDPQTTGLQQNISDLKAGLAEAGCSDYRLVELPIPEPIYYRGARTPASYCNFLITNEQVIVPQFGASADQQAIEIITPLFPSREIVGLLSRHLSVGLGSFHCLTQQQPTAT